MTLPIKESAAKLRSSLSNEFEKGTARSFPFSVRVAWRTDEMSRAILLIMRHTSDHITIDLLALGILRHEGEIVLVQQDMGGNMLPGWVIPGGMVEAGELITEALVREIKEEAGIRVRSVARLACVCQIDRPCQRAQSLIYIFEIDQWEGTLASGHDPDKEVLAVEQVSLSEAMERLSRNGGWSCIQIPLIAFLSGEVEAGACWFFREDEGGQHFRLRIPG